MCQQHSTHVTKAQLCRQTCSSLTDLPALQIMKKKIHFRLVLNSLLQFYCSVVHVFFIFIFLFQMFFSNILHCCRKLT